MNVANDKCLRKPCGEIVRVENTPGNLGIDGRRVKVKEKSSRNRPGVAQMVPGDTLPDFHDMKMVKSSVSRTGRLYPKERSCYSFLLGAQSTSGPWCGRKEISH
jgi:hypothetical protein